LEFLRFPLFPLAILSLSYPSEKQPSRFLHKAETTFNPFEVAAYKKIALRPLRFYPEQVVSPARLSSPFDVSLEGFLPFRPEEEHFSFCTNFSPQQRTRPFSLVQVRVCSLPSRYTSVFPAWHTLLALERIDPFGAFFSGFFFHLCRHSGFDGRFPPFHFFPSG